MSITYRRLLPAESQIYREIRLESLKNFPESFEATYEEALKTEKFRMENDIEHQNPGRFVIGAFESLKLIGICVFVKEEDNTGKIYQMDVKEDFQEKKVGFGLIQAVINEARCTYDGIRILLEVISTHYKAYHLYRKIGFKEINSSKETAHIEMEYCRSL